MWKKWIPAALLVIYPVGMFVLLMVQSKDPLKDRLLLAPDLALFCLDLLGRLFFRPMDVLIFSTAATPLVGAVVYGWTGRPLAAKWAFAPAAAILLFFMVIGVAIWSEPLQPWEEMGYERIFYRVLFMAPPTVAAVMLGWFVDGTPREDAGEGCVESWTPVGKEMLHSCATRRDGTPSRRSWNGG